MEQELAGKLQEQEVKIEEIRIHVKAMRRYMQVTFWVTVIFFIVPLIGALYAVPKVMNSYLGSLNIQDFNELEGL